MENIQIQQQGIAQVNNSTQTTPVSETELEQTIGVSLVADYNEQLANVAKSMQENLNQKQDVQADITKLQTIQTRDIVEKGGKKLFEITNEEAENLKAQYPALDITQQDDKNFVSKTSLEGVLMNKQQELASLNTNSEMVSLQIQSIVDQRKQAVTILSNLIASRNDVLMTIARNLKS